MNSFFTTYAIISLVAYSLITSSKGSTVILSTTHSSSVFSTLSHLSTIRSSTATPAFSTSAKNASAIISSRSHNYSISSTIFEYTSTNYPVSSFIVFTTTPTDPKKLHYQFPENESNPCIRFDGEVDLQISYKNQTQEKISLTQGATVSGVCPDKNRSFYITLSSPAVIFTINFLQDSESWHLHSFDVKLVKVDLAKNLKNDQADLKVPLNHSYVCDTDESFPATTSPNYNVTVTFRHLKLQPFKSNGTFDSPFECPAKDNPKKTSSVVPIAVGGALAGLIVIVLVAYLIGRRRGNRGYQKV